MSRRRRLMMGLWLLLAAGLLVVVVHQHYPVGQWLFVRYLRYWGFAALFVAASFVSGQRILRWMLPWPPRLGERLTLGMALGVLAFALGVFLGGLLGLLGRVFFFAWPALLLGMGARQARADWVRLSRHLRKFGPRLYLPNSGIQALAAALLLLSVVAVYLQILTPQNTGYDALWYHLTLAHQYAIAGAIRPFPEGWYLGAYPQLASLLYTWAFLSPGSLFDHQMLAAHLEWVLFLATLLSLASLVRKLLPHRRALFAGAAVFLFPGIFICDSSLISGADHVLAFWAPAIGIAMIRLGRGFTVREAVLLGTLTAAAVLTKYQASYFVVPAGAYVLMLVARRRTFRPALAFAVAGLVVSSPHWLKNWAWYGDPFYPLLHRWLPSHPFHQGAAELLDRAFWVDGFALKGTFWERVLRTLRAQVDFSFLPHDWSSFHGDKPVFGSLFTLSIPLLLFLKDVRRLWLSVLAIQIGLVVWFVTSHQDRFLQALLPWMAACTAAVFMRAWQEGRWVRFCVASLVAVQLVWGSDAYFFRTHSMTGDAIVKASIDLIGAGHRKEYANRFAIHSEMREIGEKLAPSDKVLLHVRREHFGLPNKVVTDELGWQGAIDYLVLRGPVETGRLWRQMGITHVMWRTERGDMSPEDLAREAVFQSAARRYGIPPQQSMHNLRWHKLSGLPDSGTGQDLRIAWLGCDGDPPLGIYDSPGLAKREPATKLDEKTVSATPLVALATVDALVLRPSCAYTKTAAGPIAARFDNCISAGDVSLWLRKP